MTTPERRALFLTGGSRGLGARIVLDSVAAGFDVAFTYFNDEDAARRVVAEARALDGAARVSAHALDVRCSEQVERVGDAVIEQLGRVDVVVCNAGITRVGLMFSMSDADWRDVIDTNLTGAFFVCRHFLPHFLANRHGRFVHVSSIAMHGMAGQAGYCASKAGLGGLSAAIAKEYGRKGITSNTVALGLFDGGLTAADASDRTVDFWKRYAPAGRLGDVAEVSRAIHFLAAAESSFINGEVLHVDGGLHQAP